MQHANTDTFDLVGKIGSMALIQQDSSDVNYNMFARLGAQLKPGMIWVSSGATEIGRIDYIKRTGRALNGPEDDDKTDYAAQGQAVLMQNYRQFINPAYGVRQVLVEHTHFNDPEKREHLRRLFIRSAQQGAVPIVNYNDPVSEQENRKMELTRLRTDGTAASSVVECVDNDETAAVIAGLVRARVLLILTSTEGIYADPHDPGSLIRHIGGRSPEQLIENISRVQQRCVGASRQGAQGARAKLEYMKKPASTGTVVVIGNGRHSLADLVNDAVPCTRIGLDGSRV